MGNFSVADHRESYCTVLIIKLANLYTLLWINPCLPYAFYRFRPFKGCFRIVSILEREIITHHPSIRPGATTHAGSWPTQEIASNHLCPWPWSSNFWLPAPLHPSSLHPSIRPSIWGLAFPLAFCPPACPRWFSYVVDYLAFVLYVLPIWAWLS